MSLAVKPGDGAAVDGSKRPIQILTREPTNSTAILNQQESSELNAFKTLAAIRWVHTTYCWQQDGELIAKRETGIYWAPVVHLEIGVDGIFAEHLISTDHSLHV